MAQSVVAAEIGDTFLSRDRLGLHSGCRSHPVRIRCRVLGAHAVLFSGSMDFQKGNPARPANPHRAVFRAVLRERLRYARLFHDGRVYRETHQEREGRYRTAPEIMTEARRRSKNIVKAQIRAHGHHISDYHGVREPLPC
jgi:hypothetical protein